MQSLGVRQGLSKALGLWFVWFVVGACLFVFFCWFFFFLMACNNCKIAWLHLISIRRCFGSGSQMYLWYKPNEGKILASIFLLGEVSGNKPVINGIFSGHGIKSYFNLRVEKKINTVCSEIWLCSLHSWEQTGSFLFLKKYFDYYILSIWIQFAEYL